MRNVESYDTYHSLDFRHMVDELELIKGSQVDITDIQIIETIDKYYGNGSFDCIKKRWDSIRTTLDSVDKVYVDDKFLEIMEYDERLTSHLSFGTVYYRLYDTKRSDYVCYFSHNSFNFFLYHLIDATLSRTMINPNYRDYKIHDSYISMDKVCKLFKPAISLSISNRRNRHVKIDILVFNSMMEPLLSDIKNMIPYKTIEQCPKPNSLFGNQADIYSSKVILDI